ncbi:MAG: UvrB/UvrC motif-containing protein [Planctomycetota bacterium]|jgi:protein arginine kinase activator
MEYCTVCKKALATIHILDLQDGEVVKQQNLCGNCAESSGVIHPKTTTMKISTQTLEDLIGSLKSEGQTGEAGTGPSCPACAMTLTEFRTRGRLGCPRCYDAFHKSLLPLLERVHDATSHRGRFPTRPPGQQVQPNTMQRLRNRLDEAIKAEDYEQAANLRDEIQRLEQEIGSDTGKDAGN